MVFYTVLFILYVVFAIGTVNTINAPFEITPLEFLIQLIFLPGLGLVFGAIDIFYYLKALVCKDSK